MEIKIPKIKIVSIGLIVLAIIALTQIPKQKAPSKNLIGKWGGGDQLVKSGNGVQKVDAVSLEFVNDSNVIITMGPKIYDAKYTADTTRSPIPFDIQFQYDGQERRVNGQIEIVDYNTLTWTVFFDSNDSAIDNKPLPPLPLFRRN